MSTSTTSPRQQGQRLSGREKVSLIAMIVFIVALHVVGWGITFAASGRHYAIGAGVFGIGTAITAYTLGMRHAFDADHIAAIDNTTRHLLNSEGRRPLSVGFWFSLGHSTVVFVMTVLLALGVKSLGGQITDDGSTFHMVGDLIGTLVSGFFLWVIAIINFVALRGIIKSFRKMRTGGYSEEELEEHLNNRGFATRLLKSTMSKIDAPWQIYPIGVLFGIGFDTVTEIGLLVLAGTSVAAGLPWWVILALPILFATGMSMFDMLDGVFMSFAYEWAFASPVRKVYYNITITGLSIAVAALIGTLELAAFAADKLGWTSGPWGAMESIDLNTVGFVIVGLFIAVWAVALAVWRFGRIEQRWQTR